jgi:pre-mRNA-splicing factor ATP-dependent RNA helicase DHX38/PRP16
VSRFIDKRWGEGGDVAAHAEWARAEAGARSIGSRASRFGPPTDPLAVARARAVDLTPLHSNAGGGGSGAGGSSDLSSVSRGRVALGSDAFTDVDAERAYYDAEEFGAVTGDDDGVGCGVFLGDVVKFRAREEAMARERSKGEAKQPKMSAKKSALLADQNAWEENRLHTSGAGEALDRGLHVTEEEEAVHLIVHNRRPPFLDARDRERAAAGGDSLTPADAALLSFGAGVSVVRDPSSDIAALARRGSTLLRTAREKRDRARMRKKFWELGGTKMGDVVGVMAAATEASTDTTGGDSLAVETAFSAAASAKEAAEKRAAENASLQAAAAAPDADADTRARARLAASSAARAAAVAPPTATAQSNFSRTKTLSAQRAFLPVTRVRAELVACLAANQIVIVVGETGSGKTTQLAQYLVEEGFAADGIVGCTQPRRVAAMSVAKRVSEEVGCALGGLVGYAIRFEDVTSDETKIKFMTDGVLLRETLRDTDLDTYAAIIMDEAHERSLHTDVLFGILRGVAARRRDFRLIVTSATMDADKFSRFFGGVPVFRIPGRTFPVNKVYAKAVPDDYVDAAVRTALTIHVSQPPGSGDILIFMTGQEDIETTCEVLAERVEALIAGGSAVAPLIVLPMYSQLPADLQARIFEASSDGARKVIVATNIAETSLTVDGVSFVIDPGLAKVKVYNPRIGMDTLTVNPISAANSDQRAGRAGRTGPGHAYRLFTESTYRRDLLASQVPEIQRTNLGNVVLLLKSLGVSDVRSFPFMDAPPLDNLAASEYALWVLGALDDTGALTKTGRAMADFPLDPPIAKMLHASRELGCTREVATVASMLSVPSVFFRPRDREAESDAAREKFFVPESDHLTLLNVYNQWVRNGSLDSWCSAHFIHAKQMRKAQEVLGQLLDLLAKHHVEVSSCNGDWDVVRKAVCSGYFFHSARLKGIGEYVNLLSGMPCSLHPSSALFGLGYTPNYVVYHELVLSNKEYMSCVTAVEPQWLAEMGSAFFAIRGATSAARAAAASEARWKAAASEAMAARLADPRKALLGGAGRTDTDTGGASEKGTLGRAVLREDAPTPLVAGVGGWGPGEDRVRSASTSTGSTWPQLGDDGSGISVGASRSASAASGPAAGTLAQRIAAAKEARETAKGTGSAAPPSATATPRRFGL